MKMQLLKLEALEILINIDSIDDDEYDKDRWILWAMEISIYF